MSEINRAAGDMQSEGEVSKEEAKPDSANVQYKKGHDVGDLVWARIIGSSYYPAIVTTEPQYKFHTKLVMDDM